MRTGASAPPTIVDALQAVIARGASAGVFRRGIDAIDVHLAISALGLFQVANRHTFGHLWRRDFTDEKVIARHRRLVVDVVLGYLGASVTPLPRVRRKEPRPPAL